MAETRPRHRHRVFIEDARRNGSYLRTTWHPEANNFVVSAWNDEVCTAAVRIPVEQAAQLISLLADGLADAAVDNTEMVDDSDTAHNPTPGWLARIIRRFQRGRPAPAKAASAEVLSWRRESA